MATDPNKLEVMLNWPLPTDIKVLRGFLGFTGYYYRRFVKENGKIARPLTQLQRKDNFSRTTEAQEALDTLKKAMAKLPVLTVPYFSKTFTIETDASNKGLGAVLLQDGRPVSFISQTLSD